MALRIIGIDHGSKEKLVKDCGAEVFLDITKFDDKTLPEEVKKVTGGFGASAVIVCTASNAAYAQALNFLRFGGTLVCVGMPEGDFKPSEWTPHTFSAQPSHDLSFMSLPDNSSSYEQLFYSFHVHLLTGTSCQCFPRCLG